MNDEKVERMFDTPVPCSRCGRTIRVALGDMIIAEKEELKRLLCEECGPGRGELVADRPRPIYVASPEGGKKAEPDVCGRCDEFREQGQPFCGNCGAQLLREPSEAALSAMAEQEHKKPKELGYDRRVKHPYGVDWLVWRMTDPCDRCKRRGKRRYRYEALPACYSVFHPPCLREEMKVAQRRGWFGSSE